MSGVITQIRGDDSNIIGDDILFRVEDNGEGANNITDRISLVLVEEEIPPDPAECEADIELDLENILGGNIQVNP